MGASRIKTYIKDNESYFESLMMNEKGNSRIKIEIINLLQKQIYKYTGGDSSISKERAQSLLDSMIYVISLYLKQFPQEDALQLVQEKSVDELYRQAFVSIRNMMVYLSEIVNNIQSSMIEVDYSVYHDTVIDGFNAFLRYYNYEYNALDSIITFDYPTFMPIQGKAGIELFMLYVRYIEIETQFCCCFDASMIQNVLINYSKNYQWLIFNMSELILKQVILKSLLYHDLQNLVIEEDELKTIYELLKNQSQIELYHLIVNAYQESASLLNLSDRVRHYFYNRLNEISSQFFHGVQNQTLEKELANIKKP